MESTRLHLPMIGVILSLGCSTSYAADWVDRTYVRTDVGPSFTEDTSAVLRFRLAPGLPPLPKRTIGAPVVRFGAGVRGDVSLGYQLTRPLAVELEAGAIWNSVQYTPDGTYQIPLTANLFYHVSLGKSWKAYLGGGVGETISKLEIAYSGFPPPVQTKGTSLAFTCQAQAGVQYLISRHVDIGFGYKFTHVDPNVWHPYDGLPATERVDTLNNHMVLVSATYKF